jgi:hypothetical protein
MPHKIVKHQSVVFGRSQNYCAGKKGKIETKKMIIQFKAIQHHYHHQSQYIHGHCLDRK